MVDGPLIPLEEEGSKAIHITKPITHNLTNLTNLTNHVRVSSLIINHLANHGNTIKVFQDRTQHRTHSIKVFQDRSNGQIDVTRQSSSRTRTSCTTGTRTGLDLDLDLDLDMDPVAGLRLGLGLGLGLGTNHLLPVTMFTTTCPKNLPKRAKAELLSCMTRTSTSRFLMSRGFR